MYQTLKFCADVHLGKLARSLRMLAIDVFYLNNVSKIDLLETARREERILLSKDDYFKSQAGITFYCIVGSDSSQQLMQVIRHFKLKDKLHPFTRCLRCNGRLEPVLFEQVEGLIPAGTAKYFNEYFICTSCGNVYWKGSHYHRMNKKIQELLDRNF